MKTVLALDPGTTHSAIVSFDGAVVRGAKTKPNLEILQLIHDTLEDTDPTEIILAIEKVESFGMAVGATVFETVFWAGRFAQAWADIGGQFTQVGRREVKLHLCGSARAKDTNVRQAILDRFGPGKEKAVGLKATPGPLYGLKGHEYSALAVALTYWDRRNWNKSIAELKDGGF